jgi:hypothetical protein
MGAAVTRLARLADWLAKTLLVAAFGRSPRCGIDDGWRRWEERTLVQAWRGERG